MKYKTYLIKQFDLSLTHSCREITLLLWSIRQEKWKQKFFFNIDMRSEATIMRKTEEMRVAKEKVVEKKKRSRI